MNQKVRVEIDSDLSDLVPVFLARKRADARAIVAAVERAEFDSVAGFAHRLKGDGGSYGFDEISMMGAELESAAQSGDLATAERVARRILSYLDQIEVIYHSSQV
ncbi:MAG TPA: Hpt domain-containing protein [Candidatus Binataceae bacterium]|nr:Hpt domain-containing protein [Candidatus Binataceae bacterium]